jgi:hypothetical protein
MSGPFADGYSGKACGAQDRAAGALDPVELVSP